jgi:hypothetical protein
LSHFTNADWFYSSSPSLMITLGPITAWVWRVYHKQPPVKDMVPGWHFWKVLESLGGVAKWEALGSWGRCPWGGLLDSGPFTLSCFLASDVNSLLYHMLPAPALTRGQSSGSAW